MMGKLCNDEFGMIIMPWWCGLNLEIPRHCESREQALATWRITSSSSITRPPAAPSSGYFTVLHSNLSSPP
ncbi:hypothetical protein EB796_018722 [Bugula neritina]|uniref:Uncharacterized protein n=1 Tax=Bugula neritina TaxID=10212 RepID=A0A7J7JBE3_BUGNE|nr:hypothetical protein EB796_018722 [Bugula neritina]